MARQPQQTSHQGRLLHNRGCPYQAKAPLSSRCHANVYSLHPSLQQIFAPPIQGFLISMFSYDPARLIAEFHKPVLILQGERDLQVSVARCKAAKTGGTVGEARSPAGCQSFLQGGEIR